MANGLSSSSLHHYNRRWFPFSSLTATFSLSLSLSSIFSHSGHHGWAFQAPLLTTAIVSDGFPFSQTQTKPSLDRCLSLMVILVTKGDEDGEWLCDLDFYYCLLSVCWNTIYSLEHLGYLDLYIFLLGMIGASLILSCEQSKFAYVPLHKTNQNLRPWFSLSQPLCICYSP